jgi:hypothetical protein
VRISGTYASILQRLARSCYSLGGGTAYRFNRYWIYKWDRYGFDNVQFDATVSGGLSYRFGL